MGRKSSILALLLITSLAFPITPSSADILHLKNGEKLEGLVVEETDNEVVIELQGGTISFSQSEVKSIEKSPFAIEKIEKEQLPIPSDTTGGEEPTETYEYKGRKYTKERFERLVEKKGLKKYKGEWLTEHEIIGCMLEQNQTSSMCGRSLSMPPLQW